jgi:hypothetical protein
MRYNGSELATVTRLLAALATAAVLVPAVPAAADEVVHCWYDRTGPFGDRQLVCRLVGSDTIVEHETIQPPPRLWPALGYDATGECWYRRPVNTGFRLQDIYGNGDAELWYRSPTAAPTGAWIVVGRVRGCTSEPVDVVTVVELVWEAIETFEFVEPDPTLQPDTGVTGVATYVDLDPPDTVVESFTSPVTGALVEVEFAVPLVIVDWGDGVEEFTPSLYDLFGPYPDGAITHTYETKDFYDVTVEYEWSVRWRFDGGTWNTVLEVPPTTWTNTYQVDELVGRVTG